MRVVCGRLAFEADASQLFKSEAGKSEVLRSGRQKSRIVKVLVRRPSQEESPPWSQQTL